MGTRTWGGIVVCGIYMMCHSPFGVAASDIYDVTETQLDKALLRVGQDFHLTIIFQTRDINGLESLPFSTDKDIRHVLNQLLKPHPFDYKFINNDTLVIYRAKKAKPLEQSKQDNLASLPVSEDISPAEKFTEEIVTYSRRWNSRLQSATASVALFTQQHLAAPDMGSLDQLSFQTANVTFDYTSTLSGSSNSLVSYIRGIGQSDFAIATDPAVAVYLDGVYLSRSIGSVIDLSEYNNVEIFKGPHGTIFSRNAIGGTINITSAKPRRDFHFKGRVTTGSEGRKDILMNVDIPIISEQIFGNFLFSSRNREGYGARSSYDDLTAADRETVNNYHNDRPRKSDLGDQNVDHFHGRLVWEKNRDFEVSVIADITRSRETSPVSTLRGFSDNMEGPGENTIGEFYNNCLNAIGTTQTCGGLYGVNIDENPANDRTPFDHRFLSQTPYQNYSTGPNYSNHDIFNLNASLKWQLGENILLKYIAGFRHTEADLGRDGDKTPILMDHTSYIYDHKQYSQEIQLSGNIAQTNIQWVGGMLYFYEKARMNTHVIIGGLPLMDLQATEDSKNISKRIFAHTNVPLSSDFSITGGFHYVLEEKNLQLDFHEMEMFAVRLGVPLSEFPDPDDLTLLRPNTPEKMTMNRLLPRISLEYDRDRFLAYLSVAKSIKPGGFNYRAVLPETKISSFDPEYTWSYEGGVKIHDTDNNYLLNLAIFHTDYRNLQLMSQRDVTPEIENAGNASIWGVELESQVNLMENMNISSSLGYIWAKYNKLSATSRIKSDYHFQKTPTWSFHLSADYSIPLSENKILQLRGSYSFKSETYHNAENSELLRQPPVHLLESSITVKQEDDGWALTFGVNNILDRRYIVSGFDQPGVGFTEATFSQPRQWYLALTFQK